MVVRSVAGGAAPAMMSAPTRAVLSTFHASLIRHVRPTEAAPRGSGHNSRSDTDLPKLAETHRAVGRNFLWKLCRASSQIGGGGAAGTEFLRAKCERHDWIRQPMIEVKTPIAIPQNLWQDVGQNAAAKCNPRQMSGRD